MQVTTGCSSTVLIDAKGAGCSSTVGIKQRGVRGLGIDAKEGERSK
jgi:hypothetical protein